MQYNPDGNLIRWRGIGDNIIGNNLYRKVYDRAGFVRLYSQVPVSGEWNSITDTVPLPEGCLTVHYYATAISDGYLESNPGDTVFIDLAGSMKVPPPTDLMVLTDDQGFPLLIWESMADNPSLAGFNVYRTADQGRKAEWQSPVKLNKTLIHYTLNYFTDSTAGLEGEFLYEVESVNQSGEPSALRSGFRTELAEYSGQSMPLIPVQSMPPFRCKLCH